MAFPTYSNIFRIFISCFFFYIDICLLRKCCAFERSETLRSDYRFNASIVEVNSLIVLGSDIYCNTSTKGLDKGAFLKVVHKDGTCFQAHNQKINASALSFTQRLMQDQHRINLIYSSYKPTSKIPVNSAVPMLIFDYVVKVGFGTPATNVSLVMDTGSDIAWTQCKPCSQCYQQAEPIYNYLNSKSYSNIPCKSLLCKNSTVNLLCAQNNVCIYQVLYADQTFSTGFFSREKLTLTQSEVVKNFQFGCGQSNTFTGNALVAGILGLGRGNTSIVSQTASKYKGVFSYCLPSSINIAGYLILGKTDKVPPHTIFTPILTKPNWKKQFYFIQLIAVGVGGQNLGIDPAAFSKGTTIIDSGTTLTSLFPMVYVALQTAFQKAMSKYKYPKTQSYSLQLDTCYDLSKTKKVILPKISLLFKSGAELNVDPSGILVSPKNSQSQMCLAFVDSRNPYFGIIGITQQKTYTVTYDVAGKKLGLTPGGCN